MVMLSCSSAKAAPRKNTTDPPRNTAEVSPIRVGFDFFDGSKFGLLWEIHGIIHIHKIFKFLTVVRPEGLLWAQFEVGSSHASTYLFTVIAQIYLNISMIIDVLSTSIISFDIIMHIDFIYNDIKIKQCAWKFPLFWNSVRIMLS